MTEDSATGGSTDKPLMMLAECKTCEERTNCVVGGSNFTFGSEEGPPARYSLLQCTQCYEPMLVMQNAYPPISDYDEDKPYRLYPLEDQPLSPFVPAPLASAFDEARACYRAHIYGATAVMTGRTLEATCEHFDVKERSLHGSLAKMRELGHISDQLWEWASLTKDIRNTGAHWTGKTVSRQDAEDVLAFTEALLDHLFVLKARFDALKERRANPPTSPPPPTHVDFDRLMASLKCEPITLVSQPQDDGGVMDGQSTADATGTSD